MEAAPGSRCGYGTDHAASREAPAARPCTPAVACGVRGGVACGFRRCHSCRQVPPPPPTPTPPKKRNSYYEPFSEHALTSNVCIRCCCWFACPQKSHGRPVPMYVVVVERMMMAGNGFGRWRGHKVGVGGRGVANGKVGRW